MFFALVKQAILENDPQQKISLLNDLHAKFSADELSLSSQHCVDLIPIPGRPQRPELVHPSQVAKRRLSSEQGRVALIHAVCHIEFNAINLALDAAYRFQNMPIDYYRDWLRVASEEAKHFSLLEARLLQLGSAYGELTAHNGLWEMAVKTQSSPVERMALVPRVLEARGLDVTPGMIERLQAAGDLQTVQILNIILADEIGHVEIGTRWFKYACQQAGLDPQATFIKLLRQYDVGYSKGPLHVQARKQAGFSDAEMDALTS